MGKISEMMIDRMIEEMIDPDFGEPEINYNWWTCKNGAECKVSEMTELHLRNCINMLKHSNSPLADGYIKSMTKEIEGRNKNMEKITGAQLNVVGVTFSNDDGSSRAKIIQELMKDTTTTHLEREPSNRFDHNAIMVVADCIGQIGYIGKDYSSLLAPMMDQGIRFESIVSDYGTYKDKPYCKLTINQL